MDLCVRDAALPGRWDRTVYEKLLAFRVAVGVADDTSFSFAMEDLAAFLLGTRDERIYPVLPESVYKAQAVMARLELWVYGEPDSESLPSVLASASTAQRKSANGVYEAFDVEARFGPDLRAPLWPGPYRGVPKAGSCKAEAPLQHAPMCRSETAQCSGPCHMPQTSG